MIFRTKVQSPWPSPSTLMVAELSVCLLSYLLARKSNLCSGVVTKPDMVTDGSTGSKKIWRDIVENRVEDSKLTHGYYCVRLLDDRERESEISRQEADMRASAFFDATEPWKDMDPTRLGVPNLVKTISSLLISMIEKKYVTFLGHHRHVFDSNDVLESLPFARLHKTALTNATGNSPPSHRFSSRAASLPSRSSSVFLPFLNTWRRLSWESAVALSCRVAELAMRHSRKKLMILRQTSSFQTKEISRPIPASSTRPSTQSPLKMFERF